MILHLVYQVKNNDLQQLQACIRDTVATVTNNMVQDMWTEVEYCWDICHDTRGANIEID